MRKKFLGCALATALSVLGLVGCGAGDTETVTSADSAAEVQVSDKTETEETDVAQKEITWATWGNEGELKRFEELNEAFMKANPDVKVNFIPICPINLEISGCLPLRLFVISEWERLPWEKS